MAYDPGPSMNMRQLRSVRYSVAEYHAVEMLYHQTVCLGIDGYDDHVAHNNWCHRPALEALMQVLEKLLIHDDERITVGRIIWPMLVAAETTQNAQRKQWIQDGLVKACYLNGLHTRL